MAKRLVDRKTGHSVEIRVEEGVVTNSKFRSVSAKSTATYVSINNGLDRVIPNFQGHIPVGAIFRGYYLSGSLDPTAFELFDEQKRFLYDAVLNPKYNFKETNSGSMSP